MTTDKSFDMAVRYLARGAKTVFEMKRYLHKKKVTPEEIETILERLKALSYLDDKRFARQFIEHRIRTKPKSVFALGYELRQKGIAPQIALDLLEELDDVTLAFSATRLKMNQWKHLDTETFKKKFMNHLRYRGFGYDACMSVWEKITQSD